MGFFLSVLFTLCGQNHDTVLMVDMSLSLVAKDPNPPHTPASDPNGLHWDGIDFIINSSEPGDRIALMVYRSNPVLTSRFISGQDDFIEIDRLYELNGERLTGRDWLKRLVAELRDFEQGCATNPNSPNTKWLKTGLITTPTLLAHGTASLLALKTVGLSGLLEQASGRQCWAMLFTDGFEQPVYDPDIPNGNLRKFEEIRKEELDFPVQMGAAKKEGLLQKFVADFVGSYRKNGVPLITFGLGDQCDRELLGFLALESGNIGNKGGGFYPATNNVAMFNTMRNVQWELRERWVKNWVREVSQSDGNLQFDVHPDFSNVGFYCYKLNSNEIAEAIDTSKGPFSLKNSAGLISSNLVGSFSSRSHWYYSFGIARPGSTGLPAPDQVRLDLGIVEQPVQGFLGVQTLGSLFTPINPSNSNPYSLKDSIPFELEFTSFSQQIRADQFQVTATLTHSDDVNGKNSRKAVSLKLVPVNDILQDKVVFRATWLPDSNPNSSGDQDPENRKFQGTWFCDYIIEGVSGNGAPLGGYKRSLIRRSFQVGGYKGFVTNDQEILLSNSNPKRTSAGIKLNLDLKYPGPSGLADPSIAMNIDPKHGWAKSINETHSKNNFSNGELDLIVQIPEGSFSEIPVGKHKVGEVRVKLPWGPSTQIPIVVKKEMFDLLVDDNQLVLDLSGEDASGSFFVTLQSDKIINEKIRFSSLNKNPENQKKVRFKSTADPDDKAGIEFQVQGLGKDIELEGGKRTPVKLSLARSEKEHVKPGNYLAEFFLEGKNTVRKKVKVAAIIDFPKFEVSDKAASEVTMPALAGGSAGFSFSFKSQLGRNVSFAEDGVKIAPGVHSDIQDERLPKPSIKVVRDNQAFVGFQIPHTVFPGTFKTNLKSSLIQEKIPLSYPMIPVSIHVYQSGVTTPTNLPVKLEKPENAFTYTGQFKLETLVTEKPVRWKLAKGKTLNQPNIDFDRIEVFLDGKRIDNQQETVANPITPKRPLEMNFRVNTKGMSPGTYYGLLQVKTLDFETDKEAGTTLDIPLQVVIQGREIDLKVDNGSSPAANVQIRCFNVTKVSGNLTFDGRTIAWSDANLVGDPAGIEDRKTGSRTFNYKVPLNGLLPGLTRVKASMENGDPRNPQILEAVSEVVRDGSLQCEPRGCKLNDVAVLRLQISPETRKIIASQELKVLATKAGSKEPPAEVILRDNGAEKDIQAEDNVFTGTFEVKETGEYAFKFIPPSNWPRAFTVKGTDLACVFTMETMPGDAGKLIYGGGIIASLFGIHGELREPNRVTIKNIHQTEARWRATILYPKNLTDSKDILNRDPETMPVTEYDGRVHMDCRLLVDPSEIGKPDSDSPRAVWEGTLPVGQELNIGLLATLSKEAEGIVFSDPMSVDDPDNKGQKIPLTTHEGLDDTNGIIIQVALDYDLGPDSKLEVNKFSRTVRVPLAFRTEPWSKRQWMLTGVLSLAGIILAIFGYRWWTTEGKDKKRGGDRVLEWFTKTFGSKAPPRGKGRPKRN